MKNPPVSKEQKRIEEARREVTYRLDRLRTAVDREVSWWPKGEKWVLPLVAFAAGVAVTRGSRKVTKRSTPRDDEP